MTYPPQQPGPPPNQPWPGPPNQQWQQPYPGYGMPGPPPKKGNGLLIGLIAGGGGLLLVIVFLVTGFVAPGFLLPHHKPVPPPAPPALDPGSASVAASKFILAVYGGNEYEVGDTACSAEREDAIDIGGALINERAQLNAGTPVQSGDNSFTVPMTGTAGSSSVNGEVTVQRQSDQSYCISNITGLS